MDYTYLYKYTDIQSGNIVYSMLDDRFEDEIGTGYVSRQCFILEDFSEYLEAIN
jgi:hypothetical protein